MKRSKDAAPSYGKTGDPFFTLDEDQRIVSWNDGASKLLGYSEAEVLGKPCWKVLGGRRGNRSWCQRNCRILRCVTHDIPPQHCYFETRTKKGRPIWVAVSTFAAKVKGKPVIAHMLISVQRESHVQQRLVRIQNSLQAPGVAGPEQRTTSALPSINEAALGPGIETYSLTRREIEVLKLVAQGYSTESIASRAGISFFTARNHIQNGLRKIGVQSRAQAVSFAYSRKLF